MPPTTLWDAGHVNRWHTNECQALRNSHDTTHQHGARVAILLRHMWPDVPADVLFYAVTHDAAEQALGDMPALAKDENPLIAELQRQLEEQWLDRYGVPNIDAEWKARVKLCDKLDAILWARSVDPSLMQRDDWKAAMQSALSMADFLGKAHTVKDMLK